MVDAGVTLLEIPDRTPGSAGTHSKTVDHILQSDTVVLWTKADERRT
jgi:hypothetical protein